MIQRISDRLRASITRLLCQRDGAAMLEFALTLPILVGALLGIVEFGRVMWAQNAFHYAVEEAARCYTLQTTSCNSVSATQTYAASITGLSYIGATPVFSVTPATACGGGITGNMVSVNYAFPFLTSFFDFSINMAAQSCYPTG
jgi:Flp pilus assembly protein TadG